MSKTSKRRPGNEKAIRDNWDGIFCKPSGLSACGRTARQFREAAKPDCSNVEFKRYHDYGAPYWEATAYTNIDALLKRKARFNDHYKFCHYRIKPEIIPAGARVLSVRQPWAWLLVNGYKNVENRTWTTNYRGEIYIHAGQKWDSDAKYWLYRYFPELAKKVYDLKEKGEIKTGGIVGKVNLDRLITNSSRPWANKACWHWEVSNAQALPFIPCKGRLSLYTYKPEAESG